MVNKSARATPICISVDNLARDFSRLSNFLEHDINAALYGTPAIATLYRHKEVVRTSQCYSGYSISTILYANFIILLAAYALRLQTSESLPTIANHMFWPCFDNR